MGEGFDDPTDPAGAEPAAPTELEADRPLPGYYRISKNGGAATVLGAAMLAVGEILEPERAVVEIVRHGEDGLEDGLDLRFGHLPDLD